MHKLSESGSDRENLNFERNKEMNIKRTFFAAIVAIAASCVHAAVEMVDGVAWTYTV